MKLAVLDVKRCVVEAATDARRGRASQRNAALRNEARLSAGPAGGSVPSTGHLCPSTCNPVRRREEAAGANASSRSAVFVVVHSDV
jgi:hypothetical protein